MAELFEERKKTFFNFRSFRREKAKKAEGLPKPGDEKEEVACKACHKVFGRGEWKENLYVCPSCGFHMPISGKIRMGITLDEGSFQELYPDVKGGDPIHFPGYPEKTGKAREKTGLSDALYGGLGTVDSFPVLAAVLDSTFFMGSMGEAVGDKFVLLVEEAIKRHLPLLVFASSGGARMQEGLFSLMQMAKTAAAIGKFRESGGLYLVVFTNPTTGGVSASFASLGDIALAEPGALIGFAGPRVIRQTIGEELPEGFQRSQFQLEHGQIDKIVERKDMKGVLSQVLRLHGNVYEGTDTKE
jgi:acetyl-CoA carboxylase carboxyl transferase subunit beta